MLTSLFDFTAPLVPGGIDKNFVDVAPIPLDGPTTLQLALAGIATLAVYALLRRPKRQPTAAQGVSRLTSAQVTAVTPNESSRDAA
ncbi:MAG: hypothetical protein WD669_11420 [Pirellulales bacterium]